MTVRALAHAIVRRYPAAWRERYEAEVRGLIDDTPVSLRDLGELVRGMFTERARELLMSDENPGRTARIFGCAAPVAGAAFTGASWLAGYGTYRLSGPWSDPVQDAGLGTFLLLSVAAVALMVGGFKRTDPQRPLVFPPDIAILMLPVLFAGAALLAAFTFVDDPSPSSSSLLPSWVQHGWNWLWMSVFSGSLIASLWPGHALLQEFAAISYAESQIRANEAWAASCREWIAHGVPSPLDDALGQVEKWTAERDRARARMRRLGYRARFRDVDDRRDDPPGSA